jgi:hypothetical protein
MAEIETFIGTSSSFIDPAYYLIAAATVDTKWSRPATIGLRESPQHDQFMLIGQVPATPVFSG